MDNINELITLVRELQATVNTLEEAVATLDTKVQKINQLQKLLDVEIENLTFEDVLQYSSDGKWHNIQPSKIFVSGETISGAQKLTELLDVVVSNPTNGQALTYNSVDGKWYNNDVATGGGGDMANYLTKAEAALTYYPITGGTIKGNVRIEGDLLVIGGVTLYNE